MKSLTIVIDLMVYINNKVIKGWSQKSHETGQIEQYFTCQTKLQQCYEHVSDTVVDKFFRIKDRKIEFYLGWFVK
jgi:hypothetical protein